MKKLKRDLKLLFSMWENGEITEEKYFKLKNELIRGLDENDN